MEMCKILGFCSLTQTFCVCLCVHSRAPQGDKDFTPAAAQVAHTKPVPSVQKLPPSHHINQHIHQPRKWTFSAFFQCTRTTPKPPADSQAIPHTFSSYSHLMSRQSPATSQMVLSVLCQFPVTFDVAQPVYNQFPIWSQPTPDPSQMTFLWFSNQISTRFQSVPSRLPTSFQWCPPVPNLFPNNSNPVYTQFDTNFLTNF